MERWQIIVILTLITMLITFCISYPIYRHLFMRKLHKDKRKNKELRNTIDKPIIIDIKFKMDDSKLYFDSDLVKIMERIDDAFYLYMDGFGQLKIPFDSPLIRYVDVNTFVLRIAITTMNTYTQLLNFGLSDPMYKNCIVLTCNRSRDLVFYSTIEDGAVQFGFQSFGTVYDISERTVIGFPLYCCINSEFYNHKRLFGGDISIEYTNYPRNKIPAMVKAISGFYDDSIIYKEELL